MPSGFKSLVLATVLVSSGYASFAQTAAPTTPAADAQARPPMAAASGARPQHGGMRGPMDPAKMEAMVAKHHAALKAKLKITAEQEGAWTSFTTAMKPPASMMEHKRPDRSEMDKLTTPERIDKMRALRTQHMADMTAAMDKRDEATKSFYAVLNADQKKIFDAEHTRMGGRHHGEHHRGGGASGTPQGEKPAAK